MGSDGGGCAGAGDGAGKLVSESKPLKPGHVRVYHQIGRGGTLESVREHGLLTHNELFKRGLTSVCPDKKRAPCLPDHYDVIYFESFKTPPTSAASVGFDVDPLVTFVQNSEFRTFSDGGLLYRRSKILLATYLARSQEADIMKRMKRPGFLLLDPFTATPLHVAADDKRAGCIRYRLPCGRINDYQYMYPNEITVHRPCIPPEELIFPEQDALRA